MVMLGGQRSTGPRRGMGIFVTADTRLRLARSRIDPGELVAHDPPVAVQDLEVQQAIGWHFDVERSVRSKRRRSQHSGERASVVLPDRPGVGVGAVPATTGTPSINRTNRPRRKTSFSWVAKTDEQTNRPLYAWD